MVYHAAILGRNRPDVSIFREQLLRQLVVESNAFRAFDAIPARNKNGLARQLLFLVVG